MTDNYAKLAARLRSVVNHKSPEWIKKAFSIIPEAADAIEALVTERDQLRAELAWVREALVAALEYDGGVSYEDNEGSVGYHVCCSGASYNPHKPYCWVPKARSALAAGKGEGEK